MNNFNSYVIELETDNCYKVCIENVYTGTVTDNGLIDDAVTTVESALDMFGFSFMNFKAVRYQLVHDRMFLSDYYVYFYDKDNGCIVRCEADNVGLTAYMLMCDCIMLGYTRKFMRNRFDVDSRDISSGFMANVRVLDL